MLSDLASPGRINVSSIQVPPGPPSPTLSTSSVRTSVSWMAEKTSSELIPLLKNAYSALKDKEKDLVLAAELGKSLLEHNMKLKSSYDSLLQLSTPPITPSCSTNTVQEMNDIDDDDMKFIPSKVAREAMIEVLERKNAELSLKLEQAVTEQENIEKSNSKRTRQLENEIVILKSNLDIASTKIQELQEINQKQKKLESSQPVNNSNDDLVEELYTELNKMGLERDSVLQSKSDLESKLGATLKDLNELKKQFEKFEFTQQDFTRLQEAYDSQFKHISELNQSLEEHRNLLQKLKDRGINIHSTRSTPAPSVSGEDSLSDSDSFRKNTLLQELETEWLRSNSSDSDHRQFVSSPYSSSPSSEMYHLRDFQEFQQVKPLSIGFESVLSKATGIDQHLLDETLDFIQRLEQEHNREKYMDLYNNFMDNEEFQHEQDYYPSTDLYPDTSLLKQIQIQPYRSNEPKTFIGRILSHIKRLFNYIWRWCRFTIILTIALLINAWKGPDSLYVTY